MKIVLVGGGKVGFALCRSLVAENHDVVLIEQDEAVLNHIVSRYDIIGLLEMVLTLPSWSKPVFKSAISLSP